MARAMLLVVLLVASLGLATAHATAQAPQRGRLQWPVCHKPGTPDQRTLMLPEPALRAHIGTEGHGDTLGPCGVPPPGPSCPDLTASTIHPGPPVTLELTFQDPGPNFLYLEFIRAQSTNVEVVIPPFDPATATPVTVSANRIDNTLMATVTIGVRIDTTETSTVRFCTTTF